MQLFDVLNYRIFKPLAGKNQGVFSELLMLIWDHCRTSADYGMGKGEMVRLAEDFLEGAGFELTDLDTEGDMDDGERPQGKDLHSKALWCIARLRACGWLEDLEVGYEEDARTAVCPQVVPILQAFRSIVRPQTVTYSGKLNKAYKLLAGISTERAPYENILKEVAGATEELNAALRGLNASIGSFIDQMTQHKTPQEVLDLFEKYEEEVVVAAYQRFKTSDNLFNYRESLLDGLDSCQDTYLDALVSDYCKVERCRREDALSAIHHIIERVRDDLALMGELIAEIDKNHITYRQRAVQRAQFMLLTDGTSQGMINSLLRYYTQLPETSLLDIDESPLSRMWRVYPVDTLNRNHLAPPVSSKRPTAIEPLQMLEPLDEEEALRAHQEIWEYARRALTLENVNTFAKRALKDQIAVRASTLAETAGEEFPKIVALHAYSCVDSRAYEIETLDNWVVAGGYRFKEFVIKRKV